MLKKGGNGGRRLNSGLLGRSLARKGISHQSGVLCFPLPLVWRYSLRAFEICDIFNELEFQALANEER